MKVHWYFDVISPYAWLHCDRMRRAPLPAGIELVARPVLFAGLLAHWGQLGPAEVSPKRIFTYRHVQWLAGRDGTPLVWPPGHPFNPLALNRLCCLLGDSVEAIHAVFAWVWRDGHDPRDHDGLCRLAEGLGVAAPAERLADDALKAQLRTHTDAAIAAGVFGVPSLVARDVVLWGQDSLAMLAALVADPELFDAPEYVRALGLPVLADRRG